jgi:hypothetical protein
MENVVLLAIAATILFLVIKFVEMKYLDKEFKPMKVVVRDGLIVFISTIVSAYGYFYMNTSITDFFNVITETKTLDAEATQIFTDSPGF